MTRGQMWSRVVTVTHGYLKVNVKLRIDADLHEALQRLAEVGERTVAGEMRLALRAHVRAHTRPGLTQLETGGKA